MTRGRQRLVGQCIGIVVVACISSTVAADPVWTEREVRVLRSLRLPPQLTAPTDPSNRYSGDARAAAFGSLLFSDPNLSGNREVSCASCHQPENYFANSLDRDRGTAPPIRNTPSIVNAAFNAWFYWDGRKDSLWSQALNPFEAIEEMGGSRLAVAREIGSNHRYRKLYEEIFGPFPSLVLSDELPENAGLLGSSDMRAQWQLLGQDVQQSINLVYVNVGKSIAAFERTLVSEQTRFDVYVDQLLKDPGSPPSDILSENEISGAKLFMDSSRTQCLQCHNGSMMTNGGFHNIGSGNFSGNTLDFGRVFGLHAVLLDEFNCLGPYSDAGPADCLELRYLNKDLHVPLEGAFKVPSLRNLDRTAPYFHDGRFKTLGDVMAHYLSPPAIEDVGPHELRPSNLSNEEASQLVQFLEALSSSKD